MAFSASRSRCSRNGSPNSDDSDRVLIIGEDDETLPLRMIFCWLYKSWLFFFKLPLDIYKSRMDGRDISNFQILN